MNVKTLCLALLSFGEATGYDIRKCAAEGPFSYFLQCSYGAIYPALDDLWHRGLIERRKEKLSGRPTRYIYSLTKNGENALKETLHKPLKPDVFTSEFLVAAMLAELVEPDHMEKLVNTKRVELIQRLERMRAAFEECDNLSMQWVLSYGITIHQAAIEFLENDSTIT